MKWLPYMLAAMLAAPPLVSEEPEAQGGTQSSDWPCFQGGPENLGYRPVDLRDPVSLAWTFETGSGVYSSPAASGGVAYFGSADGHVYAVSITTGAQVWKTKVYGAVYGSSPALMGPVLFIGSHGGCLYALDRDNGREIWRHCDSSKAFRLFRRPSPVLSSPLADQNRVFYGDNAGVVRAVSADRGQVEWEFQAGDKIHDNGFAYRDGVLYVGSRDGHLYALQADSGDLIWKSRHLGDLNTTPTLSGNRVFVGAGNNKLNGLKLEDGKTDWEFSVPHKIMSSPAVDPAGNLYFGGGDGRIYSVTKNSRKRWSYETTNYVFASPLLTGATLWIGGFDGIFYALDASSGRKRWSYQTGNGIFSSPAVWENYILIGSRDDKMYCFKATRH